MNKKYELTDDSIVINGKTLYRIRALRGFGDVKKGDIGGYIEKEGNLSHLNNCWVYDYAKVFNNAVVLDDARLCGQKSLRNNTVLSNQGFW